MERKKLDYEILCSTWLDHVTDVDFLKFLN